MEEVLVVEENKLKYLKTQKVDIKCNTPDLYLVQAALSINSTCNANCLYCCGRICEKDPYMPLNKVKQVYRTLVEDMRIYDVFVTCSAELTLYPHLLELMQYVDTLNNPYVRYTQDTNGRYIPNGMIEQINSMKHYWTISISIWGYDEESWQKYQGKGGWNKFVENCKRYLTELKIPPSFSIAAINEEQREKTLSFVKKLCEETGHQAFELNDSRSLYFKSLKEVNIVPVNIRKFRAPDEGSNISKVHERFSTDKTLNFFEFNNCNLVNSSFVMDSLGYIYPCLSLNGKSEYAIGNVNNYQIFNKNALIDVFRSEKNLTFWRDNLTYGKYACDICKQCTSRICY